MRRIKRHVPKRALKRAAHRTYVVFVPNRVNPDEPNVMGMVSAATKRSAETAARRKWGRALPRRAVACSVARLPHPDFLEFAYDAEADQGEGDPCGCIPEWETFVTSEDRPEGQPDWPVVCVDVMPKRKRLARRVSSPHAN